MKFADGRSRAAPRSARTHEAMTPRTLAREPCGVAQAGDQLERRGATETRRNLLLTSDLAARVLTREVTGPAWLRRRR